MLIQGSHVIHEEYSNTREIILHQSQESRLHSASLTEVPPVGDLRSAAPELRSPRTYHQRNDYAEVKIPELEYWTNFRRDFSEKKIREIFLRCSIDESCDGC